MHYGDNKEAIPYTAIESNDIMDFLANPNIYIQNYDLMYIGHSHYPKSLKF